MKISELKDETQRVLLYGDSGSGKSTLAAQLALTHKLVWIDVERGHSVLKKLPKEAQDNIELILIKDNASTAMAAETIMQLLKNYKGSVCHKHSRYDCKLCSTTAARDTVDFNTLGNDTVVVLDSLSQCGLSILSHLCKGKPVDYKPERDDWGGLRKHTEYYLQQLQAFPANLICIAHTQDKTDEKGGIIKTFPMFGSSGMGQGIAKAFDHLVYCTIKNNRHRAYSDTLAFPKILTKSRTDFKIEALDTPSLSPIFTRGT